MIILGLLWFINSGNSIATEKVNKRLVLLEIGFLVVLFLDFLAADWLIDNKKCLNGKN
jgi:hypothetical protein